MFLGFLKKVVEMFNQEPAKSEVTRSFGVLCLDQWRITSQHFMQQARPYLGVVADVVQGAGTLLQVLQQFPDVVRVLLEGVVQERHTLLEEQFQEHSSVLQKRKTLERSNI